MFLSTSHRILLISSMFMLHFSMLQSSEKHAPKGSVAITFKSNKPSNTPPPAQTVVPEEQSLWEKLVGTGNTSKQPEAPIVVTLQPAPTSTGPQPIPSNANTPKIPGLKTKQSTSVDDCTEVTEKSPLTSQQTSATSNPLGTAYPKPVYPAQTTSSLSAWSAKWPTESYATYVQRLIKGGQYEFAHAKTPTGPKNDPNISERTGCALTETILAFATLRKQQRDQQQKLSEQQRQEFQATLDPIFLTTEAAAQKYATGSINQQRTEEALETLKTMQRQLEEEANQLLKECKAREEALKNLRIDILKQHPTPTTQPSISPQRKLTK